MVSFMEAAANTISSTGSPADSSAGALSRGGDPAAASAVPSALEPQAVSASTRESARSRDTSLFMGFFFLSK